MDFSLSTEQDILKRSARDFLASECSFEVAREIAANGCPAELWRKMADLGWTMLPFPDSYGGAGGSLLDLAVLLEELGRASGPRLLSHAMIGGLAILEAGTERQKADLLPAIAAGETIATLAVVEPNLSYDPAQLHAVATLRDGGYALSGSKLFVPDAHVADYVVCAARIIGADAPHDGMSLMLWRSKEGEGVQREKLPTIDGDQHFALTFDDAIIPSDDVLGEPNAAGPALERVLQIATVCQCAGLLGAAHRVLELAIDQGKTRVQFGQLVGAFQAVQHHCANIVVDLDLGRFLTYQAAWLLSERRPCAMQVSAAKAHMGDAFFRIVTLGHQVLGGNGLIDEHEMPLFSKRAPGAQQLYGSPDYHRELVVRSLGL